jgi:uncharacterized protein (TIGR03437 family)
VAGGSNVGDGGLATGASLLDAEGVAIDHTGNIYIADAGDNRVRMISPNGIMSTIAGTTTSNPLSSPYGVAADSRGNVFIADLGNNRIQKVSAGVATTVLSQLKSPRNVLADGAGNVYFSEFGGHRVQRINTDGSVTLIAGTGVSGWSGDGGAATLAELSYPAGLALDLYGNLYIADSGNNLIRKISGGKISTILGIGSTAGELSTPTGVAVDTAGNLYVADSGNQRIRKLTPAGTVTTIPVAARDIAVDGAGNLVAADVAHVYRILQSGAITTIAGDGGYLSRGDGGPATLARLNAPSGVALDASGNLWIADTGNGWIRMVASGSGQITTVLGGGGSLVTPIQIGFDTNAVMLIADASGYRIREWFGSGTGLTTIAGAGFAGDGGDGYPATATLLSAPRGVTESANGTIYIADTGNHRVQRIFGSVLVTVAGNGYPGFNGDGPGQGVTLNYPSGLCVDAAGNLYIADTGNNRIRKVTPDGNVTTILGPSQVNGPRGVAVDSSGNLWVADSGNHRVVAVGPGLPFTVVASQLQTPSALAVDPGSGAVYVADSGSNLVILLSPGPPVLTELPTPVTVVNAASLLSGPVAPGSLVSIFGAGLSAAQVLFDGQAVSPILSTDTQINAQIPPNATGAMKVLSGGAILLNTALNIAPCAPGIFTGPGGAGPVVAANQDGSVNSNSFPAVQGSVVSFYATGVGQCPVNATVGGVVGNVVFAGDAPGFVGVSQINVQVPVGIVPGAVDLSITAGGVQSQAGVSLFVQ